MKKHLLLRNGLYGLVLVSVLSAPVFAQNSLNTVTTKTTGGLSEFFSGFLAAIPLWLAAALVVLVSVFVAGAIKKIVGFRLSRRPEVHQEVVILTERAIYTGTVMLGLIIAFKIVNINLETLFGFMGLGIGLALKDLLSNFIAGVLILTQKKFKIGDNMKLDDGTTGKIVSIDSRVTEIKNFDGVRVIIPNAKMLNAVIQNFSANSFRRVSVPVGVHYSTPIKKAIDTILAAIKANPNIVPDPVPTVIVQEFSDSAIKLEARFWIESTGSVLTAKGIAIEKIKEALDQAGIIIPFPTTTLSLDSADLNLMKALHLPTAKAPTPAMPVPPKPNVSPTV